MAQVHAGWPYFVAQIGRETVLGTAVAATEIWRGPFGGFTDERKRLVAEEDVGILVNTERSYDTFYGAAAPMPDTPLTFEQVAHLFEASVKAATPSGAGPYVRDYAPSLTDTPNTLRPYTLRLGNKIATADHRIIPGALMQEIKLAGKQGEAWMMGGTWQGTRVTTGALTGALSLLLLEEAIFAKTLLYIDASGGTIGTTQKLGVLMGCEITIDPAISFVPVGDGNLYPTAYKQGKTKVGLTLTLELEQDGANSVVASERAAYEANSWRLIRLSNTGSSAAKKLQLDLAVKWDSVGAPEKEGDHNAVVTFEGHCDYSTVDALFFAAQVTNSRASL